MSDDKLVGRIDKVVAVSYGEYMKKTIEDRAIASVIDGLKPSQRRSVYALYVLSGLKNDKFFKSARVCGDVSGKYHPHGETVIYGTVVRMVRDFVNSCAIIDGQGNFGSSEYGPAAARYTEVRLSNYAKEFFHYFDEKYSLMMPNYDGSSTEPKVFYPRVPNLIVNGCQGIAVGIRTNIPTHNLGEVIRALMHLLEYPMSTLDDILNFIKGPDFPTGGEILSKQTVKRFYETGEGSLEIRARYKIEDDVNIVFYEFPYQTNKSELVQAVSDAADNNIIEGVKYVRDESGSEGIRIVVGVKDYFDVHVVANQIYAHTRFKYSMPLCFYALDQYNSPRIYSLMEYLRTVLKHREDAVISKAIYYLERSKKRLHVLIGLNVALSYLDEIVDLIRNAENTEDVKDVLLNRDWSCNESLKNYLASVYIENVSTYRLSDEQVKSILDMSLRSLVKLERGFIVQETEKMRQEIVELNGILNGPDVRKKILMDEYQEILSKFDMPRKSEVAEFDVDMSDLSMVNPTNVMVLITNNNYIKLVDMNDYRLQNRGGKGRYTATSSVKHTILSNTRNKILFFMSSGKVYCKYVYQIPFGSHDSNGRALVNLLPDMTIDDSVIGIFSYDTDDGLNDLSAVFVFENGNVRRNYMSDFTSIRANGKQYLKDSDVKMVSVLIASNNDNVFIATLMGMAVCIPLNSFSFIKSRSSTGVKGCKLKSDDRVVDALVVKEGDNILTVTSNGFGRVSSVGDYRVTGRNSVGVKNVGKNVGKSGYVVSCVKVPDVNTKSVVVLITKEGKAVVVDISNNDGVPVAGRVGIGRILTKLNDGDQVIYAMVVQDYE